MWIKTFTKYRKSLNESVNTLNSLLSSIKAEEVDLHDALKIDKINDLDDLENNDKFIKFLSEIGLKKSNVENTKDYETFVNIPFKFMFIYKIDSNELENPYYLLLQINTDIKCYKINDDIVKFYNYLSSKTIEIIDGDDKYTYETSVGGNEWNLISNNKTDIYKNYLRKEDLEKIINDRKAIVRVI